MSKAAWLGRSYAPLFLDSDKKRPIHPRGSALKRGMLRVSPDKAWVRLAVKGRSLDTARQRMGVRLN